MAPSPECATLKDGRLLSIAEATTVDIEAIVQVHSLPSDLHGPSAPLRAYYHLKTWLYVTSRCSGVLLGRVDEQLAGFAFYCGDTAELSRLIRSPRAVFRGLSWLLTGRLGSPRLWPAFARWVRQHFAGAAKCHVAKDEAEDPVAPPSAWIGTVETVPEFRRQGVASHLLAAAKAVLWDRGTASIGSWVAEDNVLSLGLFQKEGFCRTIKVQRLGEVCWLMLSDQRRDEPSCRV
jgi:ribosomal protein S18 acetylase RimI-like enzyme